MSLTALTLNLYHDAADWPARRTVLRRELRRLDPDIVGLQEILHDDRGGQLAELFDAPDGPARPHRVHAVSKPRALRDDGRDFGNALASRWPILEHHVVSLPDGGLGREPRVLLLARVEAPFGELVVGVTHLNWRLDHGWVREQQVVAVADALFDAARGTTFPPVLLGDLNAEPDSAEVRYLLGLQSIGGRSVHLRDAWRERHGPLGGHTWSRRNRLARWSLEPERRIDYILVGSPDPSISHGGYVLDCQVVLDDLGPDEPQPTDHFGVLATLATESVSLES